MFAAKNPCEDIVNKATSEELTSENWELNLDICDRISSEGETSARNCINAIQKRLVHRNANVQLYALTLTDTLSKNCGLTIQQEIASRSFTQTISRIILDRNTHPTVKKRCLLLTKQWASEFDEESLGLMKETFDSLKGQNVGFEEPESQKPEPSSEALRAEDEELRRALELSLKDQGGRSNWAAPSQAGQPSSSSTAAPTYQTATPLANANKSLPTPITETAPASVAPAQQPQQQAERQEPASTDTAQAQQAPVASRVRALYDFAPTEPGELAFSRGDIIRVLDSVYEHWWRGEVRGEVGIFPVNYVEVLPDPTPAELQREAEMEARIFAQAASVDSLLSKFQSLDPTKDNLADDEELQELYQTSLAMRPKIVKLIDRYSTKITELKTMNDRFVQARGTFDEMMEQSLARYNPGGQSTQDFLRPRPEYNPSHASSPAPQQEYNAVSPFAPIWPQAQGYPAVVAPQPLVSSPPSQTTQAQAYSQWYYAQQQQLQQQQQPNPTQQAQVAYQQPIRQESGPGNSSSSAILAVPSSELSSSTYSNTYQQQQQQPSQQQPSSPGIDLSQIPHDDEKRRLYERARAESQAFQNQHFGYDQGSSSAMPFGSVPPLTSAGNGNGSSMNPSTNNLVQGITSIHISSPPPTA